MMSTLGGGGCGGDHLAAALWAAAFALRKTDSISRGKGTAHSNDISHLHCHFSSTYSISTRVEIKTHFSAFRMNFAKWTQLSPSATSRANQAHDNMYGKGKKRCRSPLPSEIFQIHLQLMLKNRLKNLPRFVIIIGTGMPWCNRKFCALTGNQKIFCVSFLAHKVQLPYWLSFKLKTDGGSSSERSSVDARVSKRNYDRNILQKFSI